MSLSQNIKRFRLEKELTQEQLANILGVSAQAVSKWETSETYPDGTLLVPIANALEVSLDVLFDNTACSMKDISTHIRTLIRDAPYREQMHIVRDICWQIEKGLFNCRMAIDARYSPDEIRNQKRSSYILNDFGFTHISNGRAPFFSVFPEYDDNLSQVIGDGEEMRKIFAALASPETMRAVLFIHRNEENYVFEAEVLADACGIEATNIDTVLNDLLSLQLLYKNDVEIDGKVHRLYSTKPSHKLIALLLFAHEINYSDGYCYQSHHRSKPYLR